MNHETNKNAIPHDQCSNTKKSSFAKKRSITKRKTKTKPTRQQNQPGLLLNQSELADALGVCPRTIRNWDHARIVPAIVVRGFKRYRLERVLEALERNHTLTTK